MLNLRTILPTALGATMSLVAVATADPVAENLGPREVAIGESGRGSAQGALSITLNPSGLALDRQLVFDGSYGHRTSDGATTISASACDSTVPVPGCFYYRYFANEPAVGGSKVSRRSHEFGSTVARALTSGLYLGLDVHYFDFNSDVEGEEDVSGLAADAGVTIRPAQLISLGVTGYNLVAKDSARSPAGLGVGLYLQPGASFGLSADAVWNLDRETRAGKARYGGGAEYFLRASDGQIGYPIRVGGVYDAFDRTGYLSGGLGFASVNLGLDVSIRRQVSGTGDDFAFLAGLRLFGPSGT
jgi:hypothetical protein